MLNSFVALAFFGVFAQRAAAASGSYIRLANIDSYGGSLYGGSPTQTLTEMGCQEICTADSTCFGYTFVAPATDGDLGNCYRKGKNNCDPNAIMRNDPGKYSGIIGDSCTFDCDGTTVTVKDGCSIVNPTPTPTSVRQRMRRAVEEAALAKKKLQLCPSSLTACSLNGLSTGSGYECVNLQEELERCGSCSNDCTMIPGVKGVTCSQGRCLITACGRGYKLVPGGNGKCQKKTKSSKKKTKAPRKKIVYSTHPESVI